MHKGRNKVFDRLFGGLYRGKRVLVTGHTGFKGSWLSIWLKEMGADVAGFSLDPYTERDNFVLSGIGSRILDKRGDVRDYEALKGVMEEFQPEIVFHLAAQPLVRLSYDCPKETFDTNVGGTVNVLEAIRNTNCVKVAVMITTDKCYENREVTYGYKEDDPMGGYDPYSASKGAAELAISAYIRSFFYAENAKHGKTAVASVRAGNVIGGGDWALDRIIPDCIRAIEGGHDIEVRNPGSTRPWQHVLEPLGGYLHLGAMLWKNGHAFSGAWNFGPAIESVVPVKEIVELLIRNMGQGAWTDMSHAKSVHEARLLALDCTKARRYLHWEPALNIEGTLRLTCDWYLKYREYMQTGSVYDLCIENIDSYVGEAEKRKCAFTEALL